MTHVPMIDELAIVAGVAVLVTLLLARLRLPTVAGLLAAGALVGPFGLGLATSISSIEVLAEVGVVLLLFSIGLEFSFTRLRHIFRQVAIGGALQVGLSIGAAVVCALLWGQSASRGVFYGFVFALSSTAIVLRALSERRELDAPHGRFIVGVLIFQDLCVVPMVLIVPLLGGTQGAGSAAQIAWALAQACAVVALVVVAANYLVPPILRRVAATDSRDVFLLAILGLCIGTAWLTAHVGLSLALGAFLGGMIVADTEYGHRALGDILPLRDAFVSIFFVSLGMLFDFRIVAASPWLVLGLLLAFLLGKGVLATAAAMAMRFPARAAWLAGVGLAQFGEFGFVLTKLAEQHGLVDNHVTAPLLAAGIASMFLTPLLVRLAPHISAGERLLAPLERLFAARSIDDADQDTRTLQNHVLVVGFGVAGQLVAKALAACERTFVVMDLNVENVAHGKALGLPVYYGDATSEEALHHAHIADATHAVLVMNDPLATKRVVDTLRRVAPGVHIVARTHYLHERADLVAQGAGTVIAEEVAGALELVGNLLRKMHVAPQVITAQLQAVRDETEHPDAARTRRTTQTGIEPAS